MTDHKMTYPERLAATAQLHADKWNAHGYLDAEGEPYLMATFSEMMEEAETTVVAQVKAIRAALREWGVREEDIHNHLLEHGYIEHKTEEDGK